MAAYLQALPADAGRRRAAGARVRPRRRASAAPGSTTTHCAPCHGERGEGVAGAYPALAGNRAVADDAAGQPGPHRAARRLSADDRRAIRDRSACRRSRRCSPTRDVAELLSLPARVVGPPRRRRSSRSRSAAYRGASVALTLAAQVSRAAARARRETLAPQNGMSSSMSLKPDVDFAAGRFAAAPAGRDAGAERS